MTRKTAVRPAPKRAAERIRETAGDLFYRQGIRAVGVDEIVARAGATKPSLYRAFSSKDALAAIYLRDHSDAKQKLFDAKIAEKPGDPRGQFRAWLTELTANGDRAELSRLRQQQRRRRISRARPSGAQTGADQQAQVPRPAEQCRQDDGGAASRRCWRTVFLLVIEGAYATGQMFGADGPVRVLVETADMLIDAHLARGA